MSGHTFFKCRSNVFPLERAGKVTTTIFFIFCVDLIATGLCHLKECQDRDLPPELHYIRYIGEVPVSTLAVFEDDEEPTNVDKMLRIVICMTKESSHRLLQAQYLQSDIAFKRITGFLEFEIGG